MAGTSCSAASSGRAATIVGSANTSTKASDTAHTNICVSPTAPTPMILPSIRYVGLIADTMISAMRLVFSSSVARITATAHRRMTM